MAPGKTLARLNNSPPTNPTKRRKIDFSEGSTITVVVGSEQQKFIVHRDVLTKSSTFFQCAIKPSWTRSRDRQIKMPDQDVTAFEIYINWLYSGTIDLWKDGDVTSTYKNDRGKTYEEEGSRYFRIIHSFVLGDYVNDDGFCNALIDSFFDVCDLTNQWPGKRPFSWRAAMLES